MIIGIGLDIVEINRIKENANLEKLSKRILANEELEIFNSFNSLERKYEFLSGRFAAKEAYFKALGIGMGKIAFNEVVIVYDALGKPYIKHNSNYKIHLSITHSKNYALSQVIIEE